MRKSRGSSVRGRQTARKGKSIKRSKIDFSDIPELSDKQLSSMRRVGRPTLGKEPRKLIATRLDPKVLGWLRKTAEKKGLPYQSFIHDILAKEMRKIN
ncbi:MAG: BrnA antitoxin family protein [Candidatus Binatia bacterium]